MNKENCEKNFLERSVKGTKNKDGRKDLDK